MHHDPNPFDEGSADDNPFSVSPTKTLSLNFFAAYPGGLVDLEVLSEYLMNRRCLRGRMEEAEAASSSTGSGRPSPSASGASAGATPSSTSRSTPWGYGRFVPTLLPFFLCGYSRANPSVLGAVCNAGLQGQGEGALVVGIRSEAARGGGVLPSISTSDFL